MRINKIFKSKFKLIYLLPIYLYALILLLSSVFVLGSDTKGDASGQINGTSISGDSPVIKVLNQDNNISSMELEKYLVGVVAAEMPPSFEDEALKAQAVAARTYILNKQGKDNVKHPDADVCTDSSHCKAYISDSEAKKKWGDEWNGVYSPKITSAVSETFGEIVTYNEEPIIAVFHSTSTGKTENSEDVWQSETPYLKSVESPGEELSPRYKSQAEFSIDEFKNKITELNKNVNFGLDKASWIKNYEYTEGGSVKSVTIGGCKFSGTDIRSKFSLRSADFNISVSDKVIFYVTGNGHGVGMSQYGANYQASLGKSYKDILLKYYLNTEVKKIY